MILTPIPPIWVVVVDSSLFPSIGPLGLKPPRGGSIDDPVVLQVTPPLAGINELAAEDEQPECQDAHDENPPAAI